MTHVAPINLGGWTAEFVGPAAHVLPVNDLRDHALSETCWCRPTDNDGLIVHHSLDRREDYEEGRKPS